METPTSLCPPLNKARGWSEDREDQILRTTEIISRNVMEEEEEEVKEEEE